ncbi:alpha/beta fold hydrolase [Streptomyces sp. NPDC006435]|uniref:thioesterase II family protein n=1 Tax=Streptomyces sp. NPDC006435 TaxID=3154300 RepID=UPI0033B75DA8
MTDRITTHAPGRTAPPAQAPTGRAPRCLKVLRAGKHGAARLVCFPHAGGAANAFVPLSAALPDDIEVLAVQYPGRQERRAEPCAEGIGALADEIAGALAERRDRPLHLLGHSMGALTAFETARRLAEHGAAVRLFASAARPPSHDWGERDLDACTDGEIVEELRRLGGVPEPLLRDEETVREVLRLLRSDHRPLRHYDCPADAVLTIPVTVLVGDSDPKNTVGQVRGWADHTSAESSVEVLAGGHFALLERQSGAAPLLVDRIRGDRAPL